MLKILFEPKGDATTQHQMAMSGTTTKKDSTMKASHLFNIRFGILQETHISSIRKTRLTSLFLQIWNTQLQLLTGNVEKIIMSRESFS